MRSPLPSPSLRHAAFTLIELLTVIAIIGILAAIIIPTVGKVRESAHRAGCASNLRQIALASRMWSDENQNRIPLVIDDKDIRWCETILPYIGSGIQKDTLAKQTVFKCGSDKLIRANGSPCSYGLNSRVHPNANTATRTYKKMSVIPNLSRTILYADQWCPYNEYDGRGTSSNRISGSVSFPKDADKLINFHADKGSNYAFADGHVRLMSRAEIEALPITNTKGTFSELIYIGDS